MNNMTYEAYHATAEECVPFILKDKFAYKFDDEHWLGNGIYFFIDIDLAKWWATKPSDKYGTAGKNYAIIKVLLEANSDTIFDLRELKNYNLLPQLIEEFKRETKHIFKSCKEKPTAKKFRCKFFDWLRKSLDLNLIIAYFNKIYPKYIKEDDNNYLKDIFYAEVQLCAFNNDIIKHKERVN